MLGYTDVKQYQGGLAEWREQGRYLVVETADVVMALIDAGASVLDVRDAADYRDGHIPGARNITLDVLASDPSGALTGIGGEDTVLVYDEGAADRRSVDAARMLQDLKYRRVRRYAGGNQDWSQAGMPVE